MELSDARLDLDARFSIIGSLDPAHLATVRAAQVAGDGPS